MTDTTDPTKPVAWKYQFPNFNPVYMDEKRDWAETGKWIETPLYDASLLSEYERMKAENEELSAELEQTNDEFFEAVATIDVDADGNHVERRIPKHHLLQDRLDKAIARSEALEAEVKRLREALSIVPSHCSGSAIVFEPGVLHVNKDGSGYIAINEADFVLADDRCEGPDGPEGSVHWIARMDASEIIALRDFLNGNTTADRLADKIEDLIAEFGDDPKAAMQCLSEHLGLRRHAKATSMEVIDV